MAGKPESRYCIWFKNGRLKSCIKGAQALRKKIKATTPTLRPPTTIQLARERRGRLIMNI
jgi:hypothetical protein